MENASLVLGQLGPWTQLNRRHVQLLPFLQTADLGRAAIDAIEEENARPRLAKYGGEGFLLNLKLLAHSEGALESIGTLRLWIDPEFLLSFQGRELPVLDQLRQGLDRDLPMAQLLWSLLKRIAEDWSELVEKWDEECDTLEEQLLRRSSTKAYNSLLRLRSQVLSLRRHLLAQKSALRRLSETCPHWLSTVRYEFQENASMYERLVAELDHLRERAHLLQEERENRQNDRQNRQLYMLTLLSAIFLPLTFATGLLGVNVQGIPFAEKPWAFGGFCLSLLLIFLGQVAYLRWRKWWS